MAKIKKSKNKKAGVKKTTKTKPKPKTKSKAISKPKTKSAAKPKAIKKPTAKKKVITKSKTVKKVTTKSSKPKTTKKAPVKSKPISKAKTTKKAAIPAKKKPSIDEIKAIVKRNSPIYFKPVGEEIETGEKKKIDAIIKALSQVSGGSLLVSGYTASANSPDVEKPLSVKRARKIQSLLSGLKNFKITVKGCGAPKGAHPDQTKAEKKLLRKAEIQVQSLK
ncbi:MAG: hypothetical protein JW969_07650 [Spirochaetales bacterium]|nr:hypothetical protein [Spirochaetales bacterium]